MAVGDQITYFASPEVSIDIRVDKSLKNKVDGYQAAIANSGEITGERIQLRAKLAQAFYETTVNNSGVIKARGLSVDGGGHIVVVGQSDDGQSVVYNTGTLSADGSNVSGGSSTGGSIHFEGDAAVNTGLISSQGAEGGTGGRIEMLGDIVQNSGGAEINASGDRGGGTILIGGDYQGQNTSVRNALYNYMTPSVRFLANATGQGQGGKVILWADRKTVFQGVIEAKGGLLGGNGGFVETSGKNILQALGRVDASATQGQNGQWLLDPNNITIRNAGPDANLTSSGTNPLLLESNNDNAVVTSQTINDALDNGTDVTVQTSSLGGSQDGTITVEGGTTISKTSGDDAILTLKAHHSIIFDGNNVNPIRIESTGAGNKLNVVLNSDTDQGTDGGLGGAIKINGATINTNGGDIIMGGGSNPYTTAAIGTADTPVGLTIDNSTLSAGAGSISLRGAGRNDVAGNDQFGVAFKGGAQVSTTTGDISVNGRGGNGTHDNYGVLVDGNGVLTTLQTQDGHISLTAYGGNGSANNNWGLKFVNGAQLLATDQGRITVNATAGNGTNDNIGIFADGINGLTSDTKITTVDGDLSITGYGGLAATTNNNRGIVLTNGVRIFSSGTGDITVKGTGGAGTDALDGILVDGYSTNTSIFSQDGDIKITGIAGNGGSGGSNRGIAMIQGAQVFSAGSGNVTLEGTGGNGTNDNYGIFVDGYGTATGTLIGVADGNLSLVGNAGAVVSGNANRGIHLTRGVTVESTGNGGIELEGTGGAGGNENDGVYIQGDNNNTVITSETGNIIVTGQAGNGTADNNRGVVLKDGGQIVSTGSASITVNGTGDGQTHDNHGIMLDGNNNATYATQITSEDGDISVTGQGGGSSGNDNHGVYLQQGAKVTSAGSANILLDGVKGSGTSYSLYTTTGSNIIGDNDMTGNLTLSADDFNFNNVQLRTGGKVIFRPHTDSLSMGLNGGAGTLQFGNAYINLIDRSTVTPSSIVFGHASSATNAVTIADWDLSSYHIPLEVYGGSITSGSLNNGSGSLLLRALTGDLTVNNGSVLTSTASGNAIVLAAGQNFVNNATVDTALSTPNGRWLVYSTSPSGTTEGFSTYTKRYNRTFTGNAPSSILENGNVMLYSIAPTITITADNNSRLYGAVNPALTGGITAGLIDGDTAADAYSGSPLYGTTATNASNVGTYAITASAGTLASTLGYSFVYNPGTLTINPAPPDNSGE